MHCFSVLVHVCVFSSVDEYVLVYVRLLLLVGVLFQNYCYCSVMLAVTNSG